MERVLKRPAINNRSPPHFPEDVLIEIFLKLPVRSLFLFKSVCKHWLRLIESPNFIHLHLNRPYHNDHNLLAVVHFIITKAKNRYHSPKADLVLALISGAYKEEVPLKAFSPSLACIGVNLLGPCNGLLCLTDCIDILVFNPATRQSRQVPRPPLDMVPYNESLYNYIDRFCFGFDSVSNDYKVVGFSEIGAQESDDDDSSDACYGVEIFIFRFSTNSWTQVDDCVGPTSYISTAFSNAIFFNGAFHWLNDSNSAQSMVAFDLNKEAFKQFELPDYFNIHDHLDPYLSVLDEYMTIVAFSYTDDCLLHREDETEI